MYLLYGLTGRRARAAVKPSRVRVIVGVNQMSTSDYSSQYLKQCR